MTKSDKDGTWKPVSRRDFLRIVSVGGGSALLAACGAAPTAQQAATDAQQAVATVVAAGEAAAAPTTAPAAANGAKTTLTFWTPGGSQTYCQGFGKISENYEKIHPDIDIAEVQCGTGDQDFKQVLLARIAAGNPPDSTIIWDSPIALGARGSLEPLDDLMATAEYAGKQNWPENVLASCLWEGKTYGLPVAAGTYSMWYNEDLLASKGIKPGRDNFPKTWDEMRRLSKELVQWKDDKLVSVGFIPWGDQYTLPIWSASNGSQIYDAVNRKYTIDTEENVYMMQYAVDWIDEQYKGNYTKMNADGNWTAGINSDTGQPPAFQEGTLAMRLDGFWLVGDLYEVEVKAKNWNVASIPIGPKGTKPVSGYWPNWLVIPKGSKHEKEAFQWLDYMSGEGIKAWFANIPDLPANRKVPNDLVPARTVERRGQAFALDVTTFFRHQLEVATPMWNSPVQDFANDQIGRALELIYNKKSAPKDALADAQKACQAELDKILKTAS